MLCYFILLALMLYIFIRRLYLCSDIKVPLRYVLEYFGLTFQLKEYCFIKRSVGGVFLGFHLMMKHLFCYVDRGPCLCEPFANALPNNVKMVSASKKAVLTTVTRSHIPRSWHNLQPHCGIPGQLQSRSRHRNARLAEGDNCWLLHLCLSFLPNTWLRWKAKMQLIQGCII